MQTKNQITIASRVILLYVLSDTHNGHIGLVRWTDINHQYVILSRLDQFAQSHFKLCPSLLGQAGTGILKAEAIRQSHSLF